MFILKLSRSYTFPLIIFNKIVHVMERCHLIRADKYHFKERNLSTLSVVYKTQSLTTAPPISPCVGLISVTHPLMEGIVPVLFSQGWQGWLSHIEYCDMTGI
jgi:hypothetical protein